MKNLSRKRKSTVTVTHIHERITGEDRRAIIEAFGPVDAGMSAVMDDIVCLKNISVYYPETMDMRARLSELSHVFGTHSQQLVLAIDNLYKVTRKSWASSEVNEIDRKEYNETALD